MFVRMPVDNCMFSSQTTLLPWLSATCSEHINNFDLTTGLKCVCLHRNHEDVSAESTVIYLFVGGEHEK